MRTLPRLSLNRSLTDLPDCLKHHKPCRHPIFILSHHQVLMFCNRFLSYLVRCIVNPTKSQHMCTPFFNVLPKGEPQAQDGSILLITSNLRHKSACVLTCYISGSFHFASHYSLVYHVVPILHCPSSDSWRMM